MLGNETVGRVVPAEPATSHVGDGERQRVTWNDRETAGAGGGEALRQRAGEKQVGRAREESRTAEAFQTGRGDAKGENADMAGLDKGQQEGTGANTRM